MGGQNSKGGSGGRAPSSSLHLRDKKELAGVGVIFRKSPEGLLVVKEIVGGSSADDCGMIQPGDILSKVDETKVAKASIADVSSLVLGEPGQMVKLKFSRMAGKTKKKIKVTLKRSVRATLEPTYHVQRDGINTRVTHIHLDCLQNQEADALEAGSQAPSEGTSRDVLDAHGNVVGPGLLQRARQARLAGAGEQPGVERLDPSHPAFPGNKPAKGTTRSGSIQSGASKPAAAAKGGEGSKAGGKVSVAGPAMGQFVGGAAGGGAGISGGGEGGGGGEGMEGGGAGMGGGGGVRAEGKSELLLLSSDEDDTRAPASAPAPPPPDTAAPAVPPPPEQDNVLSSVDNGASASDLLDSFFGGGPEPAPLPEAADVAPPSAPEPSTDPGGGEWAPPPTEQEGEGEEREAEQAREAREEEEKRVEEERRKREEEEREREREREEAAQAAPFKVERQQEEGGATGGVEDWEGLAQSRVAIFENKATVAKKEAGGLPSAAAVNLEKEWAKTAARAAAPPTTPDPPQSKSDPPPTKASPSDEKPGGTPPAKPSPPAKPAIPSVGSAKKMGGGGDLAAMMAARKKAMDEQDDDGYYF